MKIIVAIVLVAILVGILAPSFCVSAAAPKGLPNIKILSIGHSYSWNSVEMLRRIALTQGVDLTVGLVYRGNCSIATHLDNLKNNTRYGEASGNPGFYLKYSRDYPSGRQFDDQYSVGAAIKDEEWDYILFQDSLDNAGFIDSVMTYLPELKREVSELAGDGVKYMWHEIWALEKVEAIPSNKVELKPYNWDQNTMYNAVTEVSQQVLSSDLGITGIVHTGEAFQIARRSGKFDPTVAGGISLNADNISHASIHGKYLASLVWFMTLTGCSIDKEKIMIPREITKEQAYDLIDFATEAVTGGGMTLGTVEEVFPSDNNSDSSIPTLNQNNSIGGGEGSSFDPMYLIPVGAAVAISGCSAAIAINKKKKK